MFDRRPVRRASARRPAAVSLAAASRRALSEALEKRVLLSGAGPLVISELLADNSRVFPDENGEFVDWIEIHNPTASPVNLGGYVLADSADRWTLPAVNLPAGGYRVVFASDKNRTSPQLHTNFKLAKEGEYLGLIRPDGVTVSDEYAPQYPEQVENVSYGIFGGAPRYFSTPTPGAANSAAGSTGVVSDTVFSVDRGFFDQPFQVRIASETPGAVVRYTTDGTPPTATTGVAYGGPITVSKTTTLRAAAFRPGLVPSDVDTQTYIFVDDVVRQTHQSTLNAGFPASWNGTAPDYGMDSDVIGQTGPDLFGGQYAATIRDDLKSIPTLSVVLPVADMFGPNGIYANPTARGDAWERATSVELIDPTGGNSEFQVNAGIQIQGGAFRNPGLTNKHSFRLLFKDKWGVSKLDFPFFGPDSADSFDSITLRAENNDGWQWSGAGAQPLYARDMWSRYAQRAMGQPSSDGNRAHLYINGIYWGLFTPSERPDAAFAESYVGGDKEQWDVLNQDGVTDGDGAAWNTMLSLADAVRNAPDEASRTAAYQRIQGNNPDGTDNPAYPDYLDVDNLIDYMLINIFTGNVDWPHRNWYAGRLRADNGIGTEATGFKFFSWDAESALGLWAGLNANNTGVNVGPAQPYDRLRASADFRRRFADRVQMHMFGDGALSMNANKARMSEILAQIDRAIVAESARWGDQHRDPPYTRADWAAEGNRIVGSFLDQRWPIVLSQLRAAGLYTPLDGPTFNQNGGRVPPDFNLLMNGSGGAVYYTFDGSDPRMPDGTLNPAARSFVTSGATLIPRGSDWKYLDNGSNQGTAWREFSFPAESGWASGAAQLGYGDGDEATVVSYGPDAGNKYTTTYFRKTFTVANPSQLANVKLRLLRDDGAVLYLNGERVAWSNFNVDAPYDYRTPALAVAEDNTFYEFDIAPSKLRAGNNVLAVEVHQNVNNSTDLSFDLELIGAAAPVPVTLPAGTTRVRARVRDAAGDWSALSEAVFHTDAAASASNLVVTEVNYHPHDPEPSLGETASTDPGDYEFIELMNTGPERIALTGAAFTLGIEFDFPLDAYLNPGERAVVVKNVAAFRSRYGPGPRILGTFTGNLGNDGQLTILKDARGALIRSFRYGVSGDWPNRADGNGASLEAVNPAGDLNDPDNWRSSSEYGGTPGTAGAGPAAGVVVNEVLTRSSGGLVDAVELHNPTGQAVNVGGWYLSDSASNFRKYRIPSGTLIAAGGYLVFQESALGFALDGDGDDVWLLQSDPSSNRLTRFIDRLEFGAAASGETWGRWPDGVGGDDLYLMSSPTLGAPNSGPRVGPVVINEIMYAPAGGGQEFVELRNVTAFDVPLDGWHFTNGIDFAFPAGAVVPANGYVLVVGGDAAAFRAAHGVPAQVPVYGPFSFEGFLNVLDNAGERLTLSRPGAAPEAPVEVDRVRYGATAPWPSGASGAGPSLARRNARLWGDTAGNWAAEVSGGSPGRANLGATDAATVAGRHVFYNNSIADGNDPAADDRDDAAIAAGKSALISGAATGASHTSYGRGLNGIMLDIAGLPITAEATLSAADFEFRVGAAGDFGSWASGPAPSISIRRGKGVSGSDRVTLVWADGAIVNQWLRVTAKATANTGLATQDVFFFGNLAGDVNSDGAVNGTDFALLAQNFGRSGPGMSFATGDLNADAAVNGTDFAILAGAFGRTLPAVQAIAATQAAPAVPAVQAAPAVPAVQAAPPTAPAAATPPPRVEIRRHRAAAQNAPAKPVARRVIPDLRVRRSVRG